MARHSNGKNTFALAGWLIAAIVAALLAIALVAWLLLRGGNGDENTSDAAAESTVQDTTAQGEQPGGKSAQAEASSSTAGTATSKQESSTTTKAKPKQSTPASKPAAGEAKFAPNTLLLLDTSDGLNPYYQPVADALAGTARGVGQKDGLVSLWNYSSPLSPTATVGYRQNLGFGPAEQAAQSVERFGTGGVPQTRSAVLAALANAKDQAVATGNEARVVLVTTGTQQDLDDAAFQPQLTDAAADNVSLSVVHLGQGEPDQVLKKHADAFSTVADPSNGEELSTAIDSASGVK